MRIIFDLVFIVFALFYLPTFIRKLGQADGKRELLRSRFGVLPERVKSAARDGKIIWVHAVSVGEVLAAKNLIRALSRMRGGFRIVLSTVTPTGNKVAKENLSDAAEIFYFPFDVSFITEKVVEKLNPKVIILMETEIWPNLILSARKRSVPVGIVNGRISARSFKRYMRIRKIMSKVLGELSFAFVQTRSDRTRLVKLSVPENKVEVTGNMKFDDAGDSEVEAVTKDDAGFSNDDLIFLAGSTHKGEEGTVIDVFKGVRARFPNLKLILAPRHVERAKEIETLSLNSGLTARRFSGGAGSGDILILDVVGHLKRFYALADVVFVGGSLIKHGGQNPIEPAIFRKPILTGPNVFNFALVYRNLFQAGGAVLIRKKSEFERDVRKILEEKELAQRLGERAFRVVNDLKGATENNLRKIEAVIANNVKKDRVNV